MAEELYTVDDAAQRLELHPRTIRRYIKEGKLPARKIGKEWRITGTALARFAGLEPSGGEGERAAAAGGTGSRSERGSVPRVNVSAVLDVPELDREDSIRISNVVLAVLNGKEPEYGEVRFDFVYYEAERKARCVFWGDPAFVGNLLVMLARITEPE